jgi:alpha-beta hydrolase superfamily lysophospholipase
MSPASDGRSFPISSDGLLLSGVLHMPPTLSKGVVIGCHGLMADKNSPKQTQLADRCNAKGMAYLRFDHRGCGQSEGDFDKDTTLANRASDLLSAVKAVYRFFEKKIPIGLFGSSLGGSVCLTVLDRISPLAVVTLAAPVQSRSIKIPEASPSSLIEEMMKNRLAFDISGTLGSAHHILILHGTRDATVPVENAHTLFSIAGEPKELMLLEGADHRVSDRNNQKKFIEASVAWLTKWLADSTE